MPVLAEAQKQVTEDLLRPCVTYSEPVCQLRYARVCPLDEGFEYRRQTCTQLGVRGEYRIYLPTERGVPRLVHLDAVPEEVVVVVPAVCGVLECARVLFVSKRAYWAFLRERGRRADSVTSFEVYGFSHPATSWWNRETDQSHNGFTVRRTNRAAFAAVVRASLASV